MGALRNSICEVCGRKFEYYSSMSKGRFCSTDCRLVWWAKHTTDTMSKPDKREVVLNAYEHKCSRCGSEKDLHIHHNTEINIDGGHLSDNPYNKIEDLDVLCSTCHHALHKVLGTWKKQNMGYNQIVKGFAMVLDGLSKKYPNLDLEDENLKNTPHRITRAWLEMLSGLDEDPNEILQSSAFPAESYDEMILLKNIEFSSICSHHFLPFLGSVDVGYIPDKEKGKVLGISKLARLTDCFARRPQLQERMAENIANALVTSLAPKGVAVRIQAKHMCISCRGIKKISSVMVTSSLKGVFRDDPSSRAEFFALINKDSER